FHAAAVQGQGRDPVDHQGETAGRAQISGIGWQPAASSSQQTGACPRFFIVLYLQQACQTCTQLIGRTYYDHAVGQDQRTITPAPKQQHLTTPVVELCVPQMQNNVI